MSAGIFLHLVYLIHNLIFDLCLLSLTSLFWLHNLECNQNVDLVSDDTHLKVLSRPNLVF